MNTKIRVFVCDDHALFREGVKTILKEESSIEVVGEAEDGRQAVEMVRRLRPDVVLMDISIPLLKGFDATRRIKQSNAAVQVLMLTIFEEEEVVARCLDSGASGYLLKDSAPDQLLYAIKTVNKGQRYMSPRVLTSVVNKYVGERRQVRTKYDLLSDREREVLVMLAEGESIKDIAGRLGISVKTVDAHKYKLMGKLDLHDRSAIIRYAVRRKLIEP